MTRKARQKERAMTRKEWTENVLHDLVKYLEMMPRSLDWKNLVADDVDVLYESIFETRVDARGVRSAEDVWRQWRDRAPVDVAASGVLEDVDVCMNDLGRLAAPLAGGAASVEDPDGLRSAIFAVGERLRATQGN
jgi:hypothetical protein